MDKHRTLDIAYEFGLSNYTDAARLLWTLKETIGRRGWEMVLLSKAKDRRARQAIQWLANIQSLQHLTGVVFTADRSSFGHGEEWPGGCRTFWYTSYPSRKRETITCGWYDGGKDDYVAGYSRKYPSRSLIMVDDGQDILMSSRHQLPHLRTVQMSPSAHGPAELPGKHVYATHLIDLAFRVRSLAH